MNMSRYIYKSVLLLTVSVIICCGLYLLSLSVLGQAIFPSQGNSSMLSGLHSRMFDSRQIAERPSYDASDSTSSAMTASKNFGPQNRDFGVTESPLLQRPAQTVCHFYGC